MKSLASSVVMAAVVKFMVSNVMDITTGSSLIRLLKLMAASGAGAIVYLVLIYFLYLRNTSVMKNVKEKIKKTMKK